MKLARWIFGIAGVYGILVVAPLYFAEAQIAQNDPPAITHPEFFYGFIGITLAWQVVFLVIARDALRHRPLMLVSVLEKLAYGVPAIMLFAQQRIKIATLAFACVDLVLGALFVLAFFVTRRAEASA
jgi:DNA polymerase III psi subunit